MALKTCQSLWKFPTYLSFWSFPPSFLYLFLLIQSPQLVCASPSVLTFQNAGIFRHAPILQGEFSLFFWFWGQRLFVSQSVLELTVKFRLVLDAPVLAFQVQGFKTCDTMACINFLIFLFPEYSLPFPALSTCKSLKTSSEEPNVNW